MWESITWLFGNYTDISRKSFHWRVSQAKTSFPFSCFVVAVFCRRLCIVFAPDETGLTHTIYQTFRQIQCTDGNRLLQRKARPFLECILTFLRATVVLSLCFLWQAPCPTPRLQYCNLPLPDSDGSWCIDFTHPAHIFTINNATPFRPVDSDPSRATDLWICGLML